MTVTGKAPSAREREHFRLMTSAPYVVVSNDQSHPGFRLGVGTDSKQEALDMALKSKNAYVYSYGPKENRFR